MMSCFPTKAKTIITTKMKTQNRGEQLQACLPDHHNNLYSCEPQVHQWSQSTLSGLLKRKFGTLWKKEQFCVEPLEVIMYDDQAWDLQTIRSFVLAATLHSHSITQKVRIAHILQLIIKPDCQTSVPASTLDTLLSECTNFEFWN